jgi:hypothetical protein
MKNTDRSDRILNSLDGLQKAMAPHFFYTRLIGRMQNEQPVQKSRLLLRPVILTISLSVVLLLNIVALTKMNATVESKHVIPSGEAATIQSFANAYNLNTESVYE